MNILLFSFWFLAYAGGSCMWLAETTQKHTEHEKVHLLCTQSARGMPYTLLHACNTHSAYCKMWNPLFSESDAAWPCFGKSLRILLCSVCFPSLPTPVSGEHWARDHLFCPNTCMRLQLTLAVKRETQKRSPYCRFGHSNFARKSINTQFF